MKKIKKILDIKPKTLKTTSPQIELIIGLEGGYRIRCDLGLKEMVTKVNEPNPSIEALAKIEAKILEGIYQNLPDSHTYLRIHTYYMPEGLLSVSKHSSVVEYDTKHKGTHLYLFPDCQDKNIWQAFFETSVNWDTAKSIFLLDRNPDNWEEVIDHLYKYVEYKHLGKKIPNVPYDISTILEKCLLIGYSVDTDFVIPRVFLNEVQMLSILQNIAAKENLELIVKRISLI
jgi:hypothetical protein